jgi:hypothetical protein
VSGRIRSEGGCQGIFGHCSRDLLVPFDISEPGGAVACDPQRVLSLFAWGLFITLEDGAEVARRLAATMPGGACLVCQGGELASWTMQSASFRGSHLQSQSTRSEVVQDLRRKILGPLAPSRA